MKINVLTPIKAYDGTELKTRESADAADRTLTFRDVAGVALNSTLQGETLTAENKAKSFQISTKLWSGKEVDFIVSELAYIQERSGVVLSALWDGRVKEITEVTAKKAN